MLGVLANAEIKRNGNNFIASSSSAKSDSMKTEYTYTNSHGETYSIYLSAKGKAFIGCVSKKNGKYYRRYIPEIGRKINPKAYNN